MPVETFLKIEVNDFLLFIFWIWIEFYTMLVILNYLHTRNHGIWFQSMPHNIEITYYASPLRGSNFYKNPEFSRIRIFLAS